MEKNQKETVNFTVPVLKKTYTLSKPTFLIICGTLGLISLSIISISLALTFINQDSNTASENIKYLNAKPTDISIEPLNPDPMGIEPNAKFILKTKIDLDQKALASTLKTEPKVDVKIQKRNSQEYEIDLSSSLEPDQILKFILPVKSQETGEEISITQDLSWAFQTKNKFRILGSLPDDKAQYVPVDSGIEITFSHEGVSNLAPFFEISPPTKGKFEIHDRTVVFVPESLKASTLYTVKIKPGASIPDTDLLIDDEYLFQFETAPESNANSQTPPTLYLYRNLNEFLSSDKPVFSVAQNERLTNISAKVFRLNDINDYIEILNSGTDVPEWAYFNKELTFDSSKYPIYATYENLHIEGSEYGGYIVFPESLPIGYYALEFEYNQTLTTKSLFQVSNLASYFLDTDTESLVWTIDANTSTPAAGVSVRLNSPSSKEAGKTGADGILKFERDKDKDRYVFLQREKDEELILPIKDTYGGYDPYSSSYRNWGKSDDYWSNLYLDRDLYLPTDTVHIWGLAESRNISAQASEIKAKITKYDYTDFYGSNITIAEKVLKLSPIYTFTDQLSFENLESGYYNLVIVDGKDEHIMTRSFSIAPYVKPAYRISVSTDKNFYFWDEDIKVKGLVTFFEGSPVNNLELRRSGAEETFRTNTKGEFQINYTPERRKDYSEPATAYIDISPVNAEEGDIIGRAYAKVFNNKIHLDTKIDKTESKANLNISLHDIDLTKLNYGNPDGPGDYLGKPLPNKEILISVREQWYDKIETGQSYDYINKINRKTYNYVERENFIENIKISTNSAGEANYEFPIDEDKFYKINISTTDSDNSPITETEYLSGYFYRSFWNGEDQYNLSVNFRDDLKLNERVDVDILLNNQPAPKNQPYLFFTAQRGLIDTYTSSAPNFSFDFAQRHIPNIYLRGVTFDGKTFSSTYDRNFKFNEEERRLEIKVNTDKEHYEPKEKISLTSKIVDIFGKIHTGEINISVVDEALFKLNDHKADPLPQVYGNVADGINHVYMSHQIPEQTGGGTGDACFLPGTEILMADGTTKMIEDVKKGDEILTRENEISNKLVASEVINTLAHRSSGYLLINDRLRVTPVHVVFIDGRWIYARDAKIGQHLMDLNGDWLEIKSIKSYAYGDTVYNLETQDTHTFFADGYYVHNNKGGREYFVDTAFFGSSMTDDKGMATFEFNAPDNLTSWRVTAQAISDDLFVGDTTYNFNVKLPFFLDVVINDTYLVGDRPQIKLRSFGESLNPDQKIDYVIRAPSLNLDEQVLSSKKVGEDAFFELPTLTEGEHAITFEAEHGEFRDQLTKKFIVLKSYSNLEETEFVEYKEGISIKGNEVGFTKVILSDLNGGELYRNTYDLTRSWGSRIDQILAREIARKIIAKQFGEEIYSWDENLNSPAYQSGGIRLLPYGATDLELSAKIADMVPEKFDRSSLIVYFMNIINKKDESLQRKILGLYGLASLGEPILLQANYFENKYTLTPSDEVVMALAYAKLGDKEKARLTYFKVLNQYGQNGDNKIYIKLGENQYQNNSITAKMLRLGSILNESNARDIYNYLESIQTDLLTLLEQAMYLWELQGRITTPPTTFEYEGKKFKLENGKSEIIMIQQKDLANFKLENVNGRVGILSVFSDELKDDDYEKMNSNLKLKRTYFVDDKPTNTFKESDLVKIQIDFVLDGKESCYQINDYLPSGMKAITQPRVYNPEYYYKTRWYPISVEGQKVSFCVYAQSSIGSPIIYFARITNKGEFKAESTTIQNMSNLKNYNQLRETQNITIE